MTAPTSWIINPEIYQFNQWQRIVTRKKQLTTMLAWKGSYLVREEDTVILVTLSGIHPRIAHKVHRVMSRNIQSYSSEVKFTVMVILDDKATWDTHLFIPLKVYLKCRFFCGQWCYLCHPIFQIGCFPKFSCDAFLLIYIINWYLRAHCTGLKCSNNKLHILKQYFITT